MKVSMNETLPFLTLTIETHEDFKDSRLPTLDLNIWVNFTGLVMYTFFEKPMATNLVTQRSSAMSENIKVSSLTQEENFVNIFSKWVPLVGRY